MYSPGRPIIEDADGRSRIPARLLNAELTCPICLSIVRTPHTFLERASIATPRTYGSPPFLTTRTKACHTTLTKPLFRCETRIHLWSAYIVFAETALRSTYVWNRKSAPSAELRCRPVVRCVLILRLILYAYLLTETKPLCYQLNLYVLRS